MFVSAEQSSRKISGVRLGYPWQVVARACAGSGKATWLALGTQRKIVRVENSRLWARTAEGEGRNKSGRKQERAKEVCSGSIFWALCDLEKSRLYGYSSPY